MSKQLRQFFHISNLIEWIDNESDDYQAVAAFTMNKPYLEYHKELNNLNAYCKPWVFRDYPVTVWWNKTLEHTAIEMNISRLFSKKFYPNTQSSMSAILHWHVQFEHIHPFGDWNGRVWRYLMALQCKKAWKLTKLYKFFLQEDFKEMQKTYYSYF